MLWRRIFRPSRHKSCSPNALFETIVSASRNGRQKNRPVRSVTMHGQGIVQATGWRRSSLTQENTNRMAGQVDEQRVKTRTKRLIDPMIRLRSATMQLQSIIQFSHGHAFGFDRTSLLHGRTHRHHGLTTLTLATLPHTTTPQHYNPTIP